MSACPSPRFLSMPHMPISLPSVSTRTNLCARTESAGRSGDCGLRNAATMRTEAQRMTASFHPMSSKRCMFMSRFSFGGRRNTLLGGEVLHIRRRSASRPVPMVHPLDAQPHGPRGGRAPYNLRPIIMVIRIVRLGTPRAPGEGTRIGTVRRPPRGVPKAQFATQNWYDVWFPNLAPSLATMKLGLKAETEAEWAAFTRKYKAEMATPEAKHDLELL